MVMSMLRRLALIWAFFCPQTEESGGSLGDDLDVQFLAGNLEFAARFFNGFIDRFCFYFNCFHCCCTSAWIKPVAD